MVKNNLSYLSSLAKIQITKQFEKQLTFLINWKLKKIFRKSEEVVLIYTIGKVGSSSIYKSLKQNAYFNSPVFHIHSLEPDRIIEQKAYYKNSARGAVPFHLIQSSIITKLLPKYKGKVHIITLIREPIQRELSSIFQDSFNFTSSYDLNSERMNGVVQGKIKNLIKKLPEKEWFDNELNKVFGFDIYSMSFQTDKGFYVEEKNNCRLAFIRLENLRDCFSNSMDQLFERDSKLELLDSNISEDKFYNGAYRNYKNSLYVSNEDLEILLNSTFMRKFYPDFKETIKKQWGKA